MSTVAPSDADIHLRATRAARQTTLLSRAPARHGPTRSRVGHNAEQFVLSVSLDGRHVGTVLSDTRRFCAALGDVEEIFHADAPPPLPQSRTDGLSYRVRSPSKRHGERRRAVVPSPRPHALLRTFSHWGRANSSRRLAAQRFFLLSGGYHSPCGNPPISSTSSLPMLPSCACMSLGWEVPQGCLSEDCNTRRDAM